MKASEFLDVARTFSNGSCEGEWRSGISRAYYSVYHEICQIFSRVPSTIRKNGGLSRNYMGHETLVNILKKCNDSEVVSIGDAFANLKNERRNADYDLRKTVDDKISKDVIADAEDLLNDIEDVTPNKIVYEIKRQLTTPLPIIDQRPTHT